MTWNCQGCFREKVRKIIHDKKYSDIDIFVIQEAEDPGMVSFKKDIKCTSKYLIDENFTEKDFHDYLLFTSCCRWTGTNGKNGLLVVFNNKGLVGENDKAWNSVGLRDYIIRVIKGYRFVFLWTHPNYIDDLVLLMRINNELLTEKMILIGDFNSSVIWDNEGNRDILRNHSAFNDIMAKYSIYSAYHVFTGEKQGAEKQKTFRQKGKEYHIDYCYCTKEIIKDVKVYPEFLNYSDHAALIFDLDI